MALVRRMSLTHSQVFPRASFALGVAEPVADFEAPKREDGTRPQARDKGLTGTPYIDDNGNRPRLAWSFRATGITAPKTRAAGKGGE